MKDMDRAVARIRLALQRKETIAVFGDYDVDGITATCLVVDALRRAGAHCLRYIPHRIDDGYGLNCAALQKLRDAGASLVVTVDCGITGVEEAAFASVHRPGAGDHGPSRVQGSAAPRRRRW